MRKLPNHPPEFTGDGRAKPDPPPPPPPVRADVPRREPEPPPVERTPGGEPKIRRRSER